MRRLGLAVAICCILVACDRREPVERAYFSGIEYPDTLPIPAGNMPTASRIRLGRLLFYDPALSRDSSLSCASCHKQSLAFSDGLKVSIGIEQRQGSRNAPGLANVAFHPYFMREGGVPSLEMQVLVPVQEHAEFDFNLLSVSDRIRLNPLYVSLSLQAYARQPDPFVITRAIAAFERTLISRHSKLDRLVDDGDGADWSEEEIRGMDLFFSDRTNCSSCHGGFNFSNYAFDNNGLYKDYTDPGRAKLSGKPEDEALFKVPSLRNVALTAPYMHDGSFADLRAVLDHYNSGGKNHPHQSTLIRPLALSESEIRALEAFLHTLSDEDFRSDPAFSDPHQ